jgi:hypothetical protein
MMVFGRLLGGTAMGLALFGTLAAPALANKISASGKNPPISTSASEGAPIDFGNDSSEYADDGECDDPRFEGPGMGPEPLLSNTGKDARDCREALEAGSVSLKGASKEPPAEASIDFGDDSGEWADDGDCDDPRFQGRGVADELVEADLLKDASDCREAFEAGTVTINPDYKGGDVQAIAYGDDASKWAHDGECDDPRFSGRGVARELVEEDRLHDATDCRAAVEAGTAVFNGDAEAEPAIAMFDYGGDASKWANDGECDDLRFEGAGVDKKLLPEDMSADASDCRAAVEAGTARIRPVYSPEYAAGAPYNSAGIDFGDNASEYADDGQCDDPRFEGPGAAVVLLDGDIRHDREDCKAAFEAGRIVLRAGVEG